MGYALSAFPKFSTINLYCIAFLIKQLINEIYNVNAIQQWTVLNSATLPSSCRIFPAR